MCLSRDVNMYAVRVYCVGGRADGLSSNSALSLIQWDCVSQVKLVT